MRRLRETTLAWGLVALFAAGGCGRGCSGIGEPKTPISASPATGATTTNSAGVQAPNSASQPKRALSAADRAGEKLGISLPDRVSGTVLPGLATLPRRALPGFDVDKALVVTVSAAGAKALGQQLSAAELRESTRTAAFFRTLIESWQRRSGVAANRVVLAFDRNVDSGVATTLRQAAQQAHTWRVVALAREGDRVLELLLDPPGKRN
jgi:hypothetical protein